MLVVFSIFGAIVITAFNFLRRRVISTAAQETIRQIEKEYEKYFEWNR